MFDDQLNSFETSDLTPMSFGETSTPSTGSTSRTQTSQTATNRLNISLPNFLDSSVKEVKTGGAKKPSTQSGQTLTAGLVHALHVRTTIESELMSELKKSGTVSREEYAEVRAEAAHLASRAVNSIRTAWEEEHIIKRPDCLIDWTQDNVPELRNIIYLGSEKHPQMAYKRARIGGVSPGQLMRARVEFEDIFGMSFGSTKARAAFEVLMTGVQHNMRWQPENSVIPKLRRHYRMDAASRVYSLAAHRANTDLILSSLD